MRYVDFKKQANLNIQVVFVISYICDNFCTKMSICSQYLRYNSEFVICHSFTLPSKVVFVPDGSRNWLKFCCKVCRDSVVALTQRRLKFFREHKATGAVWSLNFQKRYNTPYLSTFAKENLKKCYQQKTLEKYSNPRHITFVRGMIFSVLIFISILFYILYSWICLTC